MSFGSFLTGTPGKMKQYDTINPQQKMALSQLLSQSMEGLQGNKGPQEAAKQFLSSPMAQQARQNFQEQTIPGIAELFSGMGSGGGQRSSAFAHTLGQAGRGLESDLASMGQQQGQLEKNSLMQMLQMSMQPQFENIYKQGQPGFLQSVVGPMGQGLMQGLGGQFGGQQMGQQQGQQQSGTGRMDFMKLLLSAFGM